MALIINLETSTQVCSVALARDGTCIKAVRSKEMMGHAANLTLFIEKVLKESRTKITQLDAVAVSKGPGSYTGLRIGVSTAKGIAYAADLKLIGVPTLQALAIEAGQSEPFIGVHEKAGIDLLCPMIDARRMEVYSAIYDTRYRLFRDAEAEVITNASFRELLKDRKILFFGNGSEKCKNLIRHKNAYFLDGLDASAESMARLSEALYNEHEFEDLAYFEPFYLKDFIPTTPKNKVVPGR
jgi:tRNA threonylcarbamoyladenosine biosynthesis protein TsaB